MATDIKTWIDTTIEPDDVSYSIRDVEPIEGYASSVRFTVVGEFQGIVVEHESITHLKDGRHVKYTDAYRQDCISIRDELQYKFDDMVRWLSRRNPDVFLFRCRDVAFPPHQPWTPHVPLLNEEDRKGLFRFEDDSDGEVD